MCLNVVVFAETVLADDQGDIGGIPLDGIVQIDPDVFLFQLCLKLVGAFLACVMRDDNASDKETFPEELFAQTKDIHIVGDSQVTAHLVFFDVGSADDDHDLRTIGQLHQHAQLGVRRKAGQYSGSVEVVKQFSAKLQI